MATARIVLNPAKTKCVVEIPDDAGEWSAFDQVYDVPPSDDSLIIGDEEDGTRYVLADFGDGLMLYEATPLDTEIDEEDNLEEYLSDDDEEDEK